MKMEIHCCGCAKTVEAILTNGSEIYPKRKDLHRLPFWKCDTCANYVGCHHKTKNRTKPLGCIPTPELRKLRMQIHNLIDPLWRDLEGVSRKKVYSLMSDKLGCKFHSANMSTVEEAERALISANEVDIEIVEALPWG